MKHAPVLAVAALCLLLSLLAALGPGCAAGARRRQPIMTPMTIASAPVRNGQQVFMHHCNKCHPGGEAGLGPAINNKPVPGSVIRVQVRTGGGMMPEFGPDHISEADLNDIVAYLDALRTHLDKAQEAAPPRS